MLRPHVPGCLAGLQVGGAEGIVNGMDVTEWNPKTDKFLPVKYDKTSVFEGKAAAKAALQAELGLPVDPTAPLFGYIGRLEEQKGVDILLSVSCRAGRRRSTAPWAAAAEGAAVRRPACRAPGSRRLHCRSTRVSACTLLTDSRPFLYRAAASPPPQALPKVKGAQVAILGTGKAKYEALVKTLGSKNPDFKGVVKFSAPLAHMITAGADFILVPSR